MSTYAESAIPKQLHPRTRAVPQEWVHTALGPHSKSFASVRASFQSD